MAHWAEIDNNVFTSDVGYIADAAGLAVPNGVSVESVKQMMLDADRDGNLPRDNQDELNAIKTALDNTERFADCIELYGALSAKAVTGGST